MTTSINVSPTRQVELPEAFGERKEIEPGMALRVTEVGDGLRVTPLPEPTWKELREVIAAAGSLTRRQTAGEGAMVERVVAEVRAEKRWRR